MSNGQTLTADDLAAIERVEGFLRDGLALKRWWTRADATNSYAQRFPLDREFNRPAGAYGFFDEVQLDTGPLPVMGNVQEMFYDQPKSPVVSQRATAEWTRDQIREFVLHYFMRISAFREPEAYLPERRIATAQVLRSLSWCPQEDIQRRGFGFRQLYYKLKDSGQVGKFPTREHPAIIDLRERALNSGKLTARENTLKLLVVELWVSDDLAGPEGAENGVSWSRFCLTLRLQALYVKSP